MVWPMKVTAKSADHLTVESRPLFVTGLTWLLGLAALIGGILENDMGSVERLLVLVLGLGTCAVAWRLMPLTALDFDRPNGTLIVTHARITGATRSRYPFADVERMSVQFDRTDGTNLERLVLKSETGVTPLEFGFFSSPRDDVMHEINAWLDGDQSLDAHVLTAPGSGFGGMAFARKGNPGFDVQDMPHDAEFRRDFRRIGRRKVGKRDDSALVKHPDHARPRGRKIKEIAVRIDGRSRLGRQGVHLGAGSGIIILSGRLGSDIRFDRRFGGCVIFRCDNDVGQSFGHGGFLSSVGCGFGKEVLRIDSCLQRLCGWTDR